MKQKKTKIFLGLWGFIVLLSLVPSLLQAEESSVPLDKANIDITDLPSLQRGARIFMNYCSGCHSLKFVRYSSLGEGIGIVDASGVLLEEAIKKNLMFVGDKITDTIQRSMTNEEGAKWFEVNPPDLSLVARSRGSDWLYTYLRSFYLDPKRPWGVNNTVFPDVAMPDALYYFRLQFQHEKEGQAKYDQAVLDLVNFLTYVGEPVQLVRKRIGIWVLLFLGVFFVFAYLLKREYWKDVH